MAVQSLYPSFPQIELVPGDAYADEGYVPAYSFTSPGGDFHLDGAGRLVVADGITAWRQWCQKILCTERGSCAAYRDETGIDGNEALRQPTREALKSHLERAVREALGAHPMTVAVSDFVFSFDVDDVHVSFTVVGRDNANFEINQNFSS